MSKNNENQGTVLVTGGTGFIGSAVVRYLLTKTAVRIINVDKMTYAASAQTLDALLELRPHRHVKLDICDQEAVANIVTETEPDILIHLAAESHVDRSIDGPRPFIDTNIVGTYILLETAYRYYCELDVTQQKYFKFLHVSTDEVYGSLGKVGIFDENSPYRPSSPYAASKASADHLVLAWGATYGLPAVISNSTNNYGPWQFPEKLIPTVIFKAFDGVPIPLYGDGGNIRDWIHVDDHASALWQILNAGRIGERYNVGGGSERSNLDTVKTIRAHLDDLKPRSDGLPHQQNIVFVEDRPGHDFRYALKTEKLSNELGWMPHRDFDTGVGETVSWYINQEDWWRRIITRSYDGHRQGLDR